MSVSSKILIVFFPVVASLAAQAVDAADRGALDRVIACADESDDMRRLACYDREIASVRPARTSKSQTAAPSSSAASAAQTAANSSAAAASPEDSFGIEGSSIARERKNAEEEVHGTSASRNSISARITEVSKRPRGELVMKLDNGQTWVQKRAEPHFPVKAGDQVTISAGALGSFRLVNGPRSTQVTRVK